MSISHDPSWGQAVAAVSIVLGGLKGKDQALLAVTLLLSVITLGIGRTTVLQAFFAVVP
jgi:Ca2+:H+ antiporter